MKRNDNRSVSRRRFLGYATGGSAAFLLAACTQPAPAATPVPTAAPKPAAASPVVPSPAAPSPVAPSPVASPSPVAAANEAWDRVLAAGRQEGKVAVSGPIGEVRELLVDTFEKKYGIPVDFLANQGAEGTAKIATERQAGQYLWDVYVGGTSSALTGLVSIEAFDPLEPALILPDLKDPKTWRNGELEFLDPKRTLLVMTPTQRGTVFINTDLVKPGEITSHKDLLDPKWKGKMVWDDPRRAGPGQATFTFFYLHPDLGPDFIRALARQEPLVLRDFVQEADTVGRGNYPILVGGNDYSVEPRTALGVPIITMPPKDLKEGSDLNPGSGGLALMNRAPHPNAAKVYINWLLSREPQIEFARLLSYSSARLDVPADNVAIWKLPIAGAVKTYGQRSLDVRRQVGELIDEVLAGQ